MREEDACSDQSVLRRPVPIVADLRLTGTKLEVSTYIPHERFRKQPKLPFF